jgi:uncharacterized membrane protein
MHKRAFRITLALLALIGLVLAGYLVKEHYASTGASFCDINAQFNCGAVNQSQYAVFLGVPVAVLGLLYYLLLLGFAASEPILRRGLDLDDELAALLAVGLALLGLLFSAYLTGIEAFVLHVFCPLCLGSAAVVLIFNCLAFPQWRQAVRRQGKKSY